AAARDVADRRRRRESRQEDQRTNLLVVQVLLAADEPERNGLPADLLKIKPPAILLDIDDDVAPFVEGAQADAALGGFSEAFALFRGFETVIDRIAEEVRQRIPQPFDHLLVEFGLLADELDVHPLAETGRDITDQPREAAEHG